MRHPYRTTALVITAVVLLTGCQTGHYFLLVVTVLDAGTGQPVPGAKVRLDASGSAEGQRADLDAGYHAFGETGDDGRFGQEVRISPYPSSEPHWWLKVRKDGYEPAVIDVKPNPQPPGTAGEKSQLPVTVELKPLAKAP
jgi:hypothetical protein